MMDFIADYALFLLKAMTIVIAILFCLGGVLALTNRKKVKESFRIRKLNSVFKELRHKIEAAIYNKKELKKLAKLEAKSNKDKKKKTSNKRVYVLSFNGDIKASAVSHLRAEITALLTVATKEDEILVNIESPGGLVHSYGLAASQLQRIRDRQIPLTVSVDKVAASGGYMMACVANKIIAAPFAIIGSIGVIAQIPNFNRLLKKHDIDFEQVTAGKYKRTLTMFGENTKKDREKLQEELEETHTLFKDFISRHRPKVDIEKVATGEHWFATQGIELGLVDELCTSDDYLLKASEESDVYMISYQTRKSLLKKLGNATENLMTNLRGYF